MDFSDKKIALVTDWITHWGGAERVFERLMQLFPQADIYTSVYFPDRPEVFRGRNIKTSFIQKIPFLNRRHKLCMLLRPWAFESFDFSGYDLVISCSSAEAKGIITDQKKEERRKKKEESVYKTAHRPYDIQTRETSKTCKIGQTRKPVHISYLHTPTRYLWSHSEQYRNFLEFGWFNWLARLVIPWTFSWMRKWDKKAAKRPDIFIANSLNTQERIKKYYERESEVVYPFFGKNKEAIRKKQESAYFVCLGRVVPYKRFDLAVEACNRLSIPLKIFTSTVNDEVKKLQAVSGPTIEWIFGASDHEVAAGLAGARAFLMPQEEDFGIVALEAMSHGTPVIAYGKGGACETVSDQETGILFPEQTGESLIEALQTFSSLSWDSEHIMQHAEKWSAEVFDEAMRGIVVNALGISESGEER